MKTTILGLILTFTILPHSYAAGIIDLTCNKGQVVLARSMHEGHTKASAKKGVRPFAIYFDLAIEKFVSNSYKKDSYIDLSYFIEGKLLLPECKGSLVETSNLGFKD
jgi:hypothetical protein